MTIALQRPGTLANSRVTDEVTLGDATFHITFDVNKPTQRFIHQILQSGALYEPESTFAIVRALKAGDVFFDVGANCGWFSAVALACGAKVVAFEPDIENCADLLTNCPAAIAIEAAVFNKSGDALLFLNLDNDGGHALWEVGIHPHNVTTLSSGNPTRAVRAVRLDDYAEQSPTIIKIDTEGAECNVLLGAERILANLSLRMVICERHEMGLAMLGHSAEEIESIMRRHGFTWAQPTGGNVVQNWIFIR